MVEKALLSFAACFVMALPLSVAWETAKPRNAEAARPIAIEAGAQAVGYQAGMYFVDPACSRFVDHPAFCRGDTLVSCSNGVRAFTQCAGGCNSAENFGLAAECSGSGSLANLDQN